MNAKMKNGNKRTMLLIACCVVPLAFSLQACSMQTESTVSQDRRLIVHEDKFSYQAAARQFLKADIETVSSHYRSYGSGPMNLTVTYDPRSSSATARKAGDKLSKISSALKSRGVTNLNGDSLPVNGQGDALGILLDFNVVEARLSERCKTMPGMHGADSRDVGEYQLGCGVEALFAKQLARPSDLLGQEGLPPGDGRRTANMIDGGYRTGKANSKIQGESASGN